MIRKWSMLFQEFWQSLSTSSIECLGQHVSWIHFHYSESFYCAYIYEDMIHRRQLIKSSWIFESQNNFQLSHFVGAFVQIPNFARLLKHALVNTWQQLRVWRRGRRTRRRQDLEKWSRTEQLEYLPSWQPCRRRGVGQLSGRITRGCSMGARRVRRRETPEATVRILHAPIHIPFTLWGWCLPHPCAQLVNSCLAPLFLYAQRLAHHLSLFYPPFCDPS